MMRSWVTDDYDRPAWCEHRRLISLPKLECAGFFVSIARDNLAEKYDDVISPYCMQCALTWELTSKVFNFAGLHLVICDLTG